MATILDKLGFTEVLTKRPKDAYTKDEMSARFSVTQGTVNRKLAELKDAGILRSARLEDKTKEKGWVMVYWVEETEEKRK